MKRTYASGWTACAAVLLVGMALPAGAAGAPPAVPAASKGSAGVAPCDDVLQLGVSEWFSSGHAQWDISFSAAAEGPGGRSRLDWKNLDADIPVFHGEARLLPWLRIGGRFGQGDLKGRNTDTDWLEGPGFGDVVISRSEARTDGETTFYDVNVYIRLNPTSVFPRAVGQFDFLAGYQRYEEDLRDRADAWDFQLAGLNSTFDFTWEAVRLGVRGAYPVGRQVRVKGQVAALVGARYEGEAFWNLRDDYRRTPPNFVQKANGGLGYDARLGVEVRPWPNVALEAGYWLFALEAESGHETTYYADGSTSAEPVDNAENQRNGFYLSLSTQF